MSRIFNWACNMLHNLPDKQKATCETLGEVFSRSGERIFLVGGAIRALRAGDVAGMDLDFTTSASPVKIRRVCRRLAETVYDKSGVKGYGTQGVILPGGTEIEVTPFRKIAGIEAPGGDPFPELTADLLARDFTINAVAVDVAPEGWGNVVDPAGGVADMEEKILRCPADPALIIADDPLRALRAVRLAAGLSLEIEPRTRDGIKDFVGGRPGRVREIAGERVRDEIFKMLAGPAPSKAVLLMEEFGLLAVVLPEVRGLRDVEPEPGFHHKDIFEHTLGVVDRAAELRPGSHLFALAALLHDIGKPEARTMEGGACKFVDHDKIGARMAGEIAGRLRLSGDETKTLKTLVLKHHRLHQYSPEWSDAAVRRALHDLGGLYEDFLALSTADATGRDAERRAAREERLAHFLGRVEALDRELVLDPKLPLDGNEVMKLLGIGPKGRGGGGPVVGRALSGLKEKVVAGEIGPDDIEAARSFVLSREWDDEVE